MEMPCDKEGCDLLDETSHEQKIQPFGQLKDSIIDQIGIGKPGLMSPAAYDTAWLARVPEECDSSVPAYPEALTWLRENQRLDGSWGSDIEYVHDRVISTLSAAIALAQWGDKNNGNIEEDKRIIKHGLEYIRNNADRLEYELPTGGFEIILPALIRDAEKIGLDVHHQAFLRYDQMREEKLAKIPPNLVYSRKLSIVHSLEFMGDNLDLEKAELLQEPDGSVGISTSATAYLLTKSPKNAAARSYIANIVATYGNKAPEIFPFDAFEVSWSLWNLFLAGVDNFDPRVAQHIKDLKSVWLKGDGLGSSPTSSIVESDTSSMVFSVLKMAGANPDPTPLRQFETADYFMCFHYERDPCTSANIHILEALKGVDYEATEKVRKWLSSSQIDSRYWIDKWHASPYYPTAHAVIALIGVDHDLARSAIQWIITTQRADGGWGYYNRSTAEETAYCLQALSIYSREVEPIDRNVIARGRRCLLAFDGKMPDMWIARCLYTPIRVVDSSIYSALTMATDYLCAA